MNPPAFDDDLVAAATGSRHPMVGPPVDIPATAADPPGVFHASVAHSDDHSRSAGGGVAHTPQAARLAAVAEALERWAASHCPLSTRRSQDVPAEAAIRLEEWSLHTPSQRREADFPYGQAYPDDEWLTEVYDMATNAAFWVPAALVSLSDRYGPLSTSSGLAAHPSVATALLRATEEILERDAYIVTWLHQLGGRQVAVPRLADELAPIGGEVRAFDLTQEFNPYPVAVVTGTVPRGGAPRHSLGVACRARWSDAVDRAFLEMLQGTVFVGHQLATRPELKGLPSDAVTGFDEHAVYYTANPQRWDDIPLHRFARASSPPPDAVDPGSTDPVDHLEHLVDSLRAAGVRLLYRELTTVDCNQLGLRVVRVLSPELAQLHHNHRWPFLGGHTAEVGWRYEDASERGGGRPFPSPFPHALG